MSVRVSDEFAAWFEEYAAARGVKRQELLETALLGFQDDCERGVPQLREMARRQTSVPAGQERGVGQCPRRDAGLGHVWRSPQEDPDRPCRFCGLAGRVHLGESSRERALLFRQLKPPASSGWKAGSK